MLPFRAEPSDNHGIVDESGSVGVVGRERELAIAERFLDREADGLRVLLLEGVAGIGKTTVWRAVLERGTARGFHVLSCRLAATETALSLSAVVDLLDQVDDAVFDGLPAPQRRILDVVRARAEPSGGPPEPQAIGAAVRAVLADLADGRPVLVAIDDVQWVDAPSATVLGFALRRLTGARVSWAIAARSGEPAALDVDQLGLDDAIERLPVGPLPLDDIRRVLELRLDGPLTRPVLLRAYECSDGNPLFAMEVARELQRHGERSGPLPPVPPDLRNLLSGRIRRLPASTREALLVAALVPNPSVADVDEDTMAPAEEEGLVQIADDGRVHFRHPLYASAVYESAPRAARRRVHDELARRVTDPEARALHVAIAARGPDSETAAVVEEGAAHARARGGWASAATLFERAMALTPADRRGDGHRRGVLAAAHHVHAGDRRRAQAIVEGLLGTDIAPEPRADALRVISELHLDAGHVREARESLEEAATLGADPRRTAEIEMGLGYIASNEADWVRAAGHARRALEAAERAGDGGAVAEALASVVMYDHLVGRGVDWGALERAVSLENRSRLVPIRSRPSIIDASVRLYTGDHAAARRRFDEMASWLRSQADESDLAFVLLWSSWLETRCGNLDLADSQAAEAVSVARLTGSDWLEGWARMQGAWVAAHRGAVDEVRRACADGMHRTEQSGNSLVLLWIAAASALAELSVGEFGRAWSSCEPLVRLIEDRGLGEPVPSFFLPDAIEALIGLGDVDRAAGLVAQLEDRGRDLDRAWALATGARCRALLVAARGDLDGALRAVEESLDHHEAIDLPVDRARALLVRGQVERRLRRRARAGETLRDALEAFERVGMPRWEERVQAELGGLGLRRGHGNALTPSEQQVATLTARGMTRREVAAALFVSPKTVDATLVRVYRKLGVRSRAELGALMGDRRARPEMGIRPM